MSETKKCCICGKAVNGHGNNAEPVAHGECCGECNARFVVPERLRLATEREQYDLRCEIEESAAGDAF